MALVWPTLQIMKYEYSKDLKYNHICRHMYSVVLRY